MKKKLPVGIETFRVFFTEDFYYIDKTGLIEELLENWGKVNLFTRPRRFGKSLNMSMLKTFFEIGSDAALFDGLKISANAQLCEQYMGQYPVISLTLKGVDGTTFTQARNALCDLIGDEALRFEFLRTSPALSEEEKRKYSQLIAVNPPASGQDRGQAVFGMTDATLIRSLQILSSLVTKHYGKPCIILLDEYDVPLDKAFQAGYYGEMVSLIRNLFGNALKGNDSLYFAVLMGCLRISKESIFTGLNNLRANSITDAMYDEYFGFTDAEVRELLRYYDLEEQYETVRDWYDGYRFGETAVYCPWDVINYCYDMRKNRQAYPKNHWANTSGNDMVRRFIDKATAQTRQEIEELIAGESIVKTISEELTYNELDQSIENLWSVLFTTGYLTQKSSLGEGQYELAIPNLEIRELFIRQVREWFHETSRQNPSVMERFCEAFAVGDVQLIEEQLNRYLWNSISIRDTAVRSGLRENFYHGLLLGLLQYKEDWLIRSNEEAGTGYSDILIETPDRIGIVIELKYADRGQFEAGCAEAFRQIEEKQYASRLVEDGMRVIRKYAVACYKKNCRVMME